MGRKKRESLTYVGGSPWKSFLKNIIIFEISLQISGPAACVCAHQELLLTWHCRVAGNKTKTAKPERKKAQVSAHAAALERAEFRQDSELGREACFQEELGTAQMQNIFMSV